MGNPRRQSPCEPWRRIAGAAPERGFVGGVEEEGRAPAALRQHALTPFRGLPRFLAVLAPGRKRKGAQPRLCDLLAALEAVAVSAFVEPTERLIDLVQRLRLHLNEG